MPDIELMGATYPDVPAVDLPKSGGGLARFYDPDGINYASSPTSGGNADKTNAILYGTVDGTSTNVAFTATVDGLTELIDGTTVLLKNGVVTSAANFTIDVNGLGAKPVYSNMAAATRETTIFNINYTLMFIYDSTRVDGGCWINYRGYYSDANSIGYQLRTNSGTLPAQAKFYRYRLLFMSADDTHWVPSNTSTSTNATAKRDVNQVPINPFGPIVYYGTTAVVEANANVSATAIWQQYALTLGYAFNRTGAALVLNYPAPVYLKCAPQANGSAIIDADVPYVQALPSTNDGKIYIFLGIAYSATAIELRIEHPVYYHDGTGIKLWTGATGGGSSPSPSSTTPAMDGTAAVGSSTDYARADHVHPTDTGRAAASHSHGSITNAGAITSDTAVASGDKLVVADASDGSKLKRSGVAFGTSTTTFLRNDGAWDTPSGGGGGISKVTLYTNGTHSNLWIDSALTTTLLESAGYTYGDAYAILHDADMVVIEYSSNYKSSARFAILTSAYFDEIDETLYATITPDYGGQSVVTISCS